MPDGYKGGLSIGGMIGTACAAVVAIPLVGFTFLSLALGDCAPGANCWTGWGILPLEALAVGALGFGIAFISNIVAKRMTAFRGRS
jgi:hypothetical protein